MAPKRSVDLEWVFRRRSRSREWNFAREQTALRDRTKPPDNDITRGTVSAIFSNQPREFRREAKRYLDASHFLITTFRAEIKSASLRESTARTLQRTARAVTLPHRARVFAQVSFFNQSFVSFNPFHSVLKELISRPREINLVLHSPGSRSRKIDEKATRNLRRKHRGSSPGARHGQF